MVKRWQVELLKRELKAGASMGEAARRAGLSQPTARKYRDLERGAEVMSQRGGRTREDPFAEAWAGIERMLELDPGLEAKAVFEELRQRQPGRWQGGQLRTLQRRFRAWRLESGPEREVYFEQVRKPGEQCQSDFTHMGSVGVTVGGRHILLS